MSIALATGGKWPAPLEINQADVLEALGDLPEGDEHCALLDATTLKLAISDYLNHRKEPWEKITTGDDAFLQSPATIVTLASAYQTQRNQ